MPDRQTILDALSTIPDPEMPISIVDLGLVEEVIVASDTDASGSTVHVTILPTFVGCPALPMIAEDIERKVADLEGVSRVEVAFVHDPPWSVDRISPAGREQLREHGVTVPESGSTLNVPGHQGGFTSLQLSTVACPYCGSKSTRLESRFGPTRCRMIYYCDACRNSFEHMRRV